MGSLARVNPEPHCKQGPKRDSPTVVALAQNVRLAHQDGLQCCVILLWKAHLFVRIGHVGAQGEARAGPTCRLDLFHLRAPNNRTIHSIHHHCVREACCDR